MKYGKKTAVPKLRFPEFNNAWDSKALSPYLEECGSRVPATTSLPIYSSSRSGLIPQASYYDGRTIINDGEYGVVPPNCFVYRHMSDDGQFAFNVNETGEDIAVSKEYPVFRTINLDSRFLHAKLNHSPDFKAFALSQKAGGTRTRLYFSKLRSWETYIPSLHEQKKIADCLSSLEDLIAAQGGRVEALKSHKRGLMQRLFPRKGETIPRLRFPEFHDAPEWKEEALGRHIDIWSGNSPSTFTLSSIGRYPYVKVEDLNNCSKYQTTAREFCDDALGAIPKHSLLFPKRGAAIELNKIRITKSQIQIDTNLMAITPKEELTVEFLFYCISDVGLSHIADTSTIPQINNKHIIPFVIRRPSLTEQRRIANVLSAIDAVITSEVEKLDFFRTHKMGLMQQLFPSLEEA